MPGRFIDATPYADYETYMRYVPKRPPEEKEKQPTEEDEPGAEELKAEELKQEKSG